MTLSGKAEGRAQNWAARHFELSHGELAISDAVGQPADSDPVKPCYKKNCCSSVTKSWETFRVFLNSFSQFYTHTQKELLSFFPLSFCWISLTQSSYESQKLLNCSSRTAIKGAGRREHNHQDIKSLWLTPLAKQNSFTRQRGHQYPQLSAMKNGDLQSLFSLLHWEPSEGHNFISIG